MSLLENRLFKIILSLLKSATDLSFNQSLFQGDSGSPLVVDDTVFGIGKIHEFF